MNDYELLYMICDSEEDSFSILVKKYQPLIYKVVKEYQKFFKKYGYELDDLMQLGYITLYKTSSRYDTSNHSLFYSYFKKALNNMIIENIRCNNTLKRSVLNNAFSYDATIPNTSLSFIDVLSSEKKNIMADNYLIIFKNSMPITLSYIFELYYSGYSKKEISILLDIDLEEVRNSFSLIKRHALTYKSLFFA